MVSLLPQKLLLGKQGQKWKCKDDIKSYSLDRFEQVEQSKSGNTLNKSWLLIKRNMVENIRPKFPLFWLSDHKKGQTIFFRKSNIMTTKLTYALDLKTASNSLMPQLARGETILVFKVWKISCKIKELFYKELSSIVD